MSISREYVESIGFTIAKQKYYNAHKVDECLSAFKSEVIALIEENELLIKQKQELEQQLCELRRLTEGAKLVEDAESYSAKLRADAEELHLKTEKDVEDFVAKARVFADKMIEDAKARADGIIGSALSSAAALSPVKKDGRMGGALSIEQLDAIHKINAQLEEISVTQSTQLMRIRQAIMEMATDM